MQPFEGEKDPAVDMESAALHQAVACESGLGHLEVMLMLATSEPRFQMICLLASNSGMLCADGGELQPCVLDPALGKCV